MKIIIIGNGFDLSLGLKTSYKDFIQSDYFISLLYNHNTLAIYLNDKQQINNWVDIEKELTEYSNQIQDDKSKVKNDFKELKNALMDYLKEAQEEEINQNSKAFEMIKNEILDTDIVYNFNYTNSVFKVAQILGISDIEAKHSFVHGSIENKNIIFGVEDKARINDNHIFLKKSSNINFAESNIIKILNNSSEKINLVIFGHSLGITDSSYFSSYFTRHTHGSNHTKMNLYYFGEYAHDEMMFILDKYTIHNLTDFKHYNDLKFINSSI
ncbi:AbiH family protein [Aliarcobacter butzleri]|uniref:AbiH family protein n=1 Tax=Aliarcobacter butzleri TaxID=28197 RepID=UPI00125F5E2F|nr:AbiH family protein [Aliarcobacter butzleri]MCT7560432.1 bacteriophage abortive infection AbiH family protein [Aliarcobacter butzleri]MCT7628952.1 bacteriophage abortive infection AbiH family protein [Aliarcobacter butzleri]UWY60937.1 bacteriophage abortive infection AbiH family protein [Aliarcobacter butzleri]